MLEMIITRESKKKVSNYFLDLEMTEKFALRKAYAPILSHWNDEKIAEEIAIDKVKRTSEIKSFFLNMKNAIKKMKIDRNIQYITFNTYNDDTYQTIASYRMLRDWNEEIKGYELRLFRLTQSSYKEDTDLNNTIGDWMYQIELQDIESFKNSKADIW